MRRRSHSVLEQMVRAQRRTIASMCGRLDLVQRDAEIALAALTEAESRIADLETRVFSIGHAAPAYATMLAPWAPPDLDARVVVVPIESNQ